MKILLLLGIFFLTNNKPLFLPDSISKNLVVNFYDIIIEEFDGHIVKDTEDYTWDSFSRTIRIGANQPFNTFNSLVVDALEQMSLKPYSDGWVQSDQNANNHSITLISGDLSTGYLVVIFSIEEPQLVYWGIKTQSSNPLIIITAAKFEN